MFKTQYLAIVPLLLLFTTCIHVQRSSKFAADQILLGMKKDSVIAKFGNPYKMDMYYKPDSTLCEILYYGETIYKPGWVDITNILYFENNTLISLKQGDERSYNNPQVIVEKQPDSPANPPKN